MDFGKRKSRNIVSSTRSTGNGPGSSTLKDILGSETSSSEFSPLLARRELNKFYENNNSLFIGDNNNNLDIEDSTSGSDMGDSTKFLLLTNMGSVQGRPESPVSEVERVDLGSSEDPDPSILSVSDLEPRHRAQEDSLSDNEHPGRLQIVRNEKTGSYHFKVKYNKDK